MKYVQLLYHYQINSLNLFVKDITAFIEIHQFICFLQAFKQWGFRSDTGYGGRTVTFPIAFTKQCFNGHVTTKRGGDSSNGNNYVDKLTTTNMWTVCDGGGGYWLAIGV